MCVRADENGSTMEGRLLPSNDPSNDLPEARLEWTSLPNNHLPDVEPVTTPTVNDPPADHFPTYPQVNSPCFKWGNIDGIMFQNAVNCAYNEVVHWRRNIFKVPSGKAGKSFVRELSRLFRAYAEGTALESVALTAAMTLPSLLLQKPHRSSKAKEHTQCLERCMKLWIEGDLDELLREGRTIQQRLQRSPRRPRSEQQLAHTFAKLMMEGKVRAALRLISKQEGGPPIALNDTIEIDEEIHTVRDILKQKHPEGKPVTQSAIAVSDPVMNEPHPVIFDEITGILFRSVALRTEGAAGPSGIDAQGWRRLCSSFQLASSELCDALACLCKRICSTYVDPRGLTAFVACRLIALNKCPGVRPIGIGEVVRRILGKVILATIGDEIQEAAGAL